MADPINEQIAKLILAALQEVVDDGNATDVQRPLRMGPATNLKDKSLVLIQEDARRDADGAVGHATWFQEFSVVCVVKPSENSSTAIDETINTLRGHVEQKLREDINWSTLALNTTITDPQSFARGEGMGGVIVTADIHFRTLENDPFSQ